jgi:hypothetical protein
VFSAAQLCALDGWFEDLLSRVALDHEGGLAAQAVGVGIGSQPMASGPYETALFAQPSFRAAG